MLDIIKKLDSATIKALAVATVPLLALIGTFIGIDEAVFKAKAEVVVQGLLAFVTLGGIAWAAWSRLFKPNPPLTETALQKTIDMVKYGELKTVPTPPKQGGYASTPLLFLVAIVGALSALVVGCAGTKAAYKAADSLPDQAFVVAEHYSALVKEAADLAQNAATPDQVKSTLKAADNVARPLVLGLKPLADAYQATRTAQTEAELQAALNNAVVAVAGFIRAVKAARGEHVGSSDTRSRGAARGCTRVGTSGAIEDGGRLVCVG
jgi:hypothetical protein